MTMTFRLAQVTDPHFRSFAGARAGQFLGKRAVGALNIVVNRRRKHKMELLEAMSEDIRREQPDHVALTGDLSNVSLMGEWRRALDWIEGLRRTPDDVTVIPGNHDAYVAEVVAKGTFETLFAPFQRRDADDPSREVGSTGGPHGEAEHYPFVRLRGPLALIGVNSCVATGDLGAWGRVGAPQLERLRRVLGSARLEGKTRVVMIHHPPVKLKGGEERNLRDRAEFAACLASAGAELIIHGHDHRDEFASLEGPGGGSIPVVGAGSASYTGAADRRARYNIYEFGASHIAVITRTHDEATDGFREVRRERLDVVSG